MSLPLKRRIKWQFNRWLYLYSKKHLKKVISLALYGFLYDSFLAIFTREKRLVNNLARIARSTLSFAWLFGLISPVIAGIGFITDSLASSLFLRNRTSYASYTELARALKFVVGISLLLSFLH